MNPLRWLNAQLAGIAEQRRIAQELSSLSARNLADIGISEFDIPPIAREARRASIARHDVDTVAATPSGALRARTA